MKAKNLRFTLATLAILATLAACKKEPIGTIKSNDKVFSAARFKQNIITALGEQKVGYTFVISQNGKMADSAERGWARMSQDGAIKHSIYKKMNVASLNKWFTAVGAMRLMKAKGISMDDSIYKYLPKYWAKHETSKTVTFDQLLRHASGLTNDSISYGGGYNGLRTCIATGVINPAKTPIYNNGNFAMFRIMFYYMENPGAAATLEASFMATKDTLAFETALANAYIALMQQYVFTPAGIANATCVPESRSTMTLSYDELDPTKEGKDFGDWTLGCGGGGYQLSAYDVAKLMAHVYHSENLLTKAERDLMESKRYGFDGGDSQDTDHGKSYGKDGALVSGTRGLQTLLVKYPNGVELVFYINSLPGDFVNYAPKMAAAYNAAWE